MPFVTLTVREQRAPAFKNALLDAVHAALVATGVPQADRFQRVIELPAENFRFDARYPDLERDRGEHFAVIEIFWSAGRSVKVKRGLLQDLMTRLAAQDIDTEQVMVCFKETSWENWSFGGGRLLHA
ncbi:tautomerase family protein [Aquincola sp. S2]|uniref:Tautomerase family protein n=1 Tax=Pseudaquabacterium terrae TaxID=2732868 RepID=A0ABX2EH68_9BURK|nr:tautomerase family protein [Aquabacterium terrae]NRF67968.1 tautomerase family protein [Aquabacterium terrae]